VNTHDDIYYIPLFLLWAFLRDYGGIMVGWDYGGIMIGWDYGGIN
jgi:hypothetical protein